MRKITHILVHHTATPGPKTSIQGVDNAHRTRNWGTAAEPIFARKSSLGWYVQYHYFIDWAGNVTQTRREDEIGWHGNAANPFSIGICLAGYFDSGHDARPSDKQLQALRGLIIGILVRHPTIDSRLNIVPHRVFNPHKSCYGYLLPNDVSKLLIDIKEEDMGFKPRIFRIKGTNGYLLERRELKRLDAFGDGGLYKDLFGAYDGVPIIEVNSEAELPLPIWKQGQIGSWAIGGVTAPLPPSV